MITRHGRPRHAVNGRPLFRADRLAATGWVTLILVGLLWMIASEAFPQATVSVTTGGTIRQAEGVWAPIVNSAHANTAVESVTVEPDGDIRVDLLPPGVKITSAIVGVDETLAGRGIVCGPSASPTYLIVRCWRVATGEFVPGDDSELGGLYANIWIIVIQEVTA